MMNYTAELIPEMDEEHAKVGIRTIQTTYMAEGIFASKRLK